MKKYSLGFQHRNFYISGVHLGQNFDPCPLRHGDDTDVVFGADDFTDSFPACHGHQLQSLGPLPVCPVFQNKTLKPVKYGLVYALVAISRSRRISAQGSVLLQRNVGTLSILMG
ncbi:hypothetical protein D1872_269470 [compost metagenome]